MRGAGPPCHLRTGPTRGHPAGGQRSGPRQAGAVQVKGGHPTVTHPTVPSKFEAALGGVVSQKAECKLRVFLGDLLSRGGSVGLEPLH